MVQGEQHQQECNDFFVHTHTSFNFVKFQYILQYEYSFQHFKHGVTIGTNMQIGLNHWSNYNSYRNSAFSITPCASPSCRCAFTSSTWLRDTSGHAISNKHCSYCNQILLLLSTHATISRWKVQRSHPSAAACMREMSNPMIYKSPD